MAYNIPNTETAHLLKRKTNKDIDLIKMVIERGRIKQKKLRGRIN